MTGISQAITGAEDHSVWFELKTMYDAFRRRLPQGLRRQARLEYRVHYLYSMTLGVPETAYRYSCISMTSLLCWACQLVNYKAGVRVWRYKTFCNAVELARTSLNITAYQAGCLSARWGLFLNSISRVGSRALLGFYQLCYRHSDEFFADGSLQFPLGLHALSMAIWARAFCIYRYADIIFKWSIHRFHHHLGNAQTSYEWRQKWCLSCCDLLQRKVDIPIYEVAMVAPYLARSVLMRLASTIRLMVQHRLLKGPFPNAC